MEPRRGLSDRKESDVPTSALSDGTARASLLRRAEREMTTWGEPGRGLRCALAQQVRELRLPTPFDLDRFPAWLERHDHRIRLVAASLAQEGPSGVLVRAATADYLYYEKRTSKFHQAHIVLSLMARLLLGEDVGASIDTRIVPSVRPRGVYLMLGQPARTITDLEAETFVYLTLSAGREPLTSLQAFHAIQQMGPLIAGLGQAVQDDRCVLTGGERPTARIRLHQRVIAIRDAMLSLASYRDPQVATAAGVALAASGLSRTEKAAAVEAAVLADAVEAKTANLSTSRPDSEMETPPLAQEDLRTEAEWLATVARAWQRSQHEHDLGSQNDLDRCPDDLQPPRDWDTRVPWSPMKSTSLW